MEICICVVSVDCVPSRCRIGGLLVNRQFPERVAERISQFRAATHEQAGHPAITVNDDRAPWPSWWGIQPC